MAEEKSNGDQRGDGVPWAVILIAVVIAVVLILSIFAYVTYGTVSVPTLKISLTVLDGSEDDTRDRWSQERGSYLPFIDNISLRSSIEATTTIMYGQPQDSPLRLPGVVMRAYMEGKPASYWSSVRYDGPHEYSLTLFMKKTPRPGSVVSINLEVVDEEGEDMFPYFVEDAPNSVLHYVWT